MSEVSQKNDTEILRFLVCGSVDDGKSTLIGRLLYDSHYVHEDHLENVTDPSEEINFAGLLDGLKAEREQGITIDVSYRYFTKNGQRYVIVDAPGHEQYTCNMATGASVCHVAVVIMDSRSGLKLQTRRHAYIAHLFGISHVIAVVNKMDLISYSEERFREIEDEFLLFAKQTGFTTAKCVPVCALSGENICQSSEHMKWHKSGSLVAQLEGINIIKIAMDGLRFPVQWVCRPDVCLRGYAGTIEAGQISVGQQIQILPSSVYATIKDILVFNEHKTFAVRGDAVVLVLNEDVDVSRGSVFVSKDNQPSITDQVLVDLVWMAGEPLDKEKSYLLQCSVQQTTSVVHSVRYKIDVESSQEVPATFLSLNDIGCCQLSFATPLVVEPFSRSKPLGWVVLSDKVTHQTVAAGCIRTVFTQGAHLYWQSLAVDAKARAKMKGQKPFCLWLTGLSGSGKSTLAGGLEKAFYKIGIHAYVLDGDNIRHGLSSDLGFSHVDRRENIRRVAEVAKLMMDAGLVVIVSFISPFRSDRAFAREILPFGSFYEAFVDAPLNVCIKRDPKGLYKKAQRGDIKDFTGVSSPYEAPENPEMYLNSAKATPEELVDLVVKKLKDRSII